MQKVWRAALISSVLLGIAACDNKPATPPSPPIHMACTTPAQAGQKAQEITRKLGEAVTAKRISDDDYRAYNATLSTGLQAWGEKQDLKAYCAALDKVVSDAGLQ
jgi:hypothetical protein